MVDEGADVPDESLVDGFVVVVVSDQKFRKASKADLNSNFISA